MEILKLPEIDNWVVLQRTIRLYAHATFFDRLSFNTKFTLYIICHWRIFLENISGNFVVREWSTSTKKSNENTEHYLLITTLKTKICSPFVYWNKVRAWLLLDSRKYLSDVELLHMSNKLAIHLLNATWICFSFNSKYNKTWSK